ncbi:site-specific DNA-methyltransferase [Amnibacterium endophyticum]|uniref:Site-specific DNA-methyltransferase n=1 Tax=Amnibacterium endophyticum TaxID=2109337 RepID=A0ABW4LFU1_9MICO
MEKLRIESANLTERNIEKIAELFPTVVTETADTDGKLSRVIDFDALRQELSNHIVDGPRERYQLDWPGKRAAAFAANVPIAKTVRPVREESVDFDTTKNLFIEGDNLEALKLLQESYLGKVDFIYIDPPYNTGSDFIYEDDFTQSAADYLDVSRQINDEGARLVANPETNGRFHSDWLSMMYPRLKLARNLLAPAGVILISIGDSEVANLRVLAQEVFGRGNFVGQLVWEKKKKGAFLSGAVSNVKEYILCFARDRDKFAGFTGEIARDTETYPVIKTTNSRGVRIIRRGISSRFRELDHFVPAGTRLTSGNQEIVLKSDLQIREGRLADDVVVESNWIYSQSLLDQFAHDNSLYVTQDLYFRRIVTEPRRKVLKDLLTMRGETGTGARFVLRDDLTSDGWGTNEDAFDELHALFDLQNLMSFPKPTKLIAKLLAAACREAREAVVLDFFAGSGTTGDALMQLNAQDGGSRRFILVQVGERPEPDTEAAKAGFTTIAELCKERLRRAGRKALESSGSSKQSLDVGFRTLRIDTTNFASVFESADSLAQHQLPLFADNVRSDRTAEDLLFQLLIDWGLDLTETIAVEEVAGQTVFSVSDEALIACFADGVTEEVVRAIAGRRPLRAVFKDSGFASDAARINAEQVFREGSPETELRVV